MSQPKFNSLLCPSQKVTEEQLETDRKIVAFERTFRPFSRRGFIGTFAAAVAAAAVASGGRSAHGQTTSSTATVISVLNFALNLEYLEANFYLFGSTGAGLPAANTNGGAAPTNPPVGITFDPYTLSVVKALAQDEVNHIAQLQATVIALGGTPIPQPLIDFGATGAITTQVQFLAAARQFANVGGSAYAGGAQLLVSQPNVLTAAAQILGAEGQHEGAINYLCNSQGIASPAVDAQDVPPAPGTDFSVDPVHALAPARTPQQVLGIVYGVSTATTTTPAAGTTMGGFFPNGVQGSITST